MSQAIINEIKDFLGPPENFIISHKNRNELKQLAILSGYQSVEVHSMSNVQLSNLYQTICNNRSPNAMQRESAEVFARMAKEFTLLKIDPEVLRTIVKEELDRKPSTKLHVITPNSSVVIDQRTHYKTPQIIQITAINHPIMLVGPAGCGKTSICEHVAEALSLPFYVTSTINDTHELTGFIDGYGKYHTTPFRKAFETGGVWVADEIDAWDAAALLAANSALANGFCTFPDSEQPLVRHPNFRMIATANTFGSGADRVYVGRNELDAASLDRFATIEVDYDLDLERMFCRNNEAWLEHVWKIRKKVIDKKIRHVVSSRAIIMGAVALEAGLTWKDVEQIYLFKGMSEADRKKIVEEPKNDGGFSARSAKRKSGIVR